jgi:hypothetical protein
LMRRVDDSRSLPRCLDTAHRRGRPPPCPADDSAAGRPPAGLISMRRGRHARNARGLAAPGAPRVLPRGTGKLPQYCSIQYAIHSVHPPRSYATALATCNATLMPRCAAKGRPVRCARGARPSPPWSRPRRALAQNQLRSRSRRATRNHRAQSEASVH